jgi:hypothetical protein
VTGSVISHLPGASQKTEWSCVLLVKGRLSPDYSVWMDCVGATGPYNSHSLSAQSSRSPKIYMISTIITRREEHVSDLKDTHIHIQSTITIQWTHLLWLHSVWTIFAVIVEVLSTCLHILTHICGYCHQVSNFWRCVSRDHSEVFSICMMMTSILWPCEVTRSNTLMLKWYYNITN